MKVPSSWLKEYIPTKLSDEEIAQTLTTIGLEVEGIEEGVLEISLTPNLAHCLSVRGIARELGAVTGQTVHTPKFSVIEKSSESIQKHTSVTLENSDACPRYACRVIQDVRVGPSPDWLVKRLEQCGIRSVNNVVDITNLVMLELGQPLHAFDFEALAEKRIVVRNARSGESITTLDGKLHYPTEHTLLICDGKKPIALAGIMGGLATEVTGNTTTILLESAYFEPTQVRRTCKRMGIHSDAAYRFERGCDPNGVIEALDRATAWICDIAKGIALKGHVEVQKREFPTPLVSCRLSRINHLLGTHLAMSEVQTIFTRLGFITSHVGEDEISVHIPTYRTDIHHEIDLIEEAARLYGYDNLHKHEGAFYRTGTLPHSPEFVFSRLVRAQLLGEGLQEFLTCDLISPEQAALISTDTFPSRTLIKLLNPQSTEQSVMRPSLLPGMLSSIRYNNEHGIDSVAAFEVGRIHFTSPNKERFFEPAVAAIALTGERTPYHWERKGEKVDFFDLKALLENLFQGLKIPPFKAVTSHYANFHPGRQAALMIGEAEVGIMAEVHPLTLQQAGVSQPVYYAEINLEDLYSHVKSLVRMQPLVQFPASTRDLTVTVKESLPVGPLLEAPLNMDSTLLESVTLLDIYRSPALGAELKNVTLRFVYRDKEKTVALAAVEHEHTRITKKILESIH